MSAKEAAVRDAARALHAAITDAVAAGYRVAWPAHLDGLPGIAISETGKVASATITAHETPAAPAAVEEKPAGAFGRRKSGGFRQN